MIALQLNEPRIEYKEFTVSIIDEMPRLIQQGYQPISIAQIMQRRLNVLGSIPEVKDAWWMNYFDSGDAVVYHPDGKIKIVLDSPLARKLNPDITLSDGTPDSVLPYGALILPDGMYEQVQGEEFSKDVVEKYTYAEQPTVRKVKHNPIWRALARDQNLLAEYAKATFKEAKPEYNTDTKMEILISSYTKVPNLRLWELGGNLSHAIGFDTICGLTGRLVGVSLKKNP